MAVSEYIFISLIVGIVATLWTFNLPLLGSVQSKNSTDGLDMYLFSQYGPDSESYSFVIISDKDEKSLEGNMWVAVIKYGRLHRVGKKYNIYWEREEILRSKLNNGGRGMELSELVFFDGKLLTCDDRTGIVYQILLPSHKLIPKYILYMGSGESERAFKCEWMTVVNDLLYVGSVGMELVLEGRIVDNDAQSVKIIDRHGRISHKNWTDNYEALREFSDTKFPAYLFHEAIMWYPEKEEWVVLPRKCSNEIYDTTADAEKGTNIFFIASRDFSTIRMSEIGEQDPLKGTSSFKFVPFQNGDIVQLKSLEYGERIETYISVVNIYTKEILMSEVLVGSLKFEGLEFL